MAKFSKYYPKLNLVEGGYQANPNDKGNYNSINQLVGTNHGISARFYEDILGYPPSKSDMKALSKSEAKQLFEVHFWNKLLGNQFSSQSVAETVIDHHINSGNGVLLAQRLLNDRFGKNLVEDNAMGANTLAAINSVPAKSFVNQYNKLREQWYKTRHNSSEFAEGWIKRLENFVYKNHGILSLTMLLAITGTAVLSYKLINQN